MIEITTHNREATLAAWRTRMQRVTDWLVNHLEQPFDLDRLAELAYFSPYHFHRVYTVAMGEPVFETVRRLRLHRAAVQLTTSNTPIASIAKQADYGSVQAFGRIFRQAYGEPPAQYRQHASGSLALVQHRAREMARATHAQTMSQETDKEREMKGLHESFPPGLGASPEDAVQIVQRRALRVAALPHRGSYNAIGDSFQKLAAWAIGRNLLGAETVMYGLYFDDPDSKALVDLCSEACVSVPEDFALLTTDAPVHLTHTSSGRCARMLFTGPYAQLNTAYAWLYKIWLPHSGEQPGSQPPMEEYLNDPRSTAPAKLQTAIYIPLQEAAQ